MRKLNLSLAAAALLAVNTTANAEDISKPLQNTPHFNSCRAEARAKSNEYVADYLVPATAEDTAPQGAYVAIVYGHKFIAPLRQPPNGDAVTYSLGEVMAKRAQVYGEELRRCLDVINLKVIVKK